MTVTCKTEVEYHFDCDSKPCKFDTGLGRDGVVKASKSGLKIVSEPFTSTHPRGPQGYLDTIKLSALLPQKFEAKKGKSLHFCSRLKGTSLVDKCEIPKCYKKSGQIPDPNNDLRVANASFVVLDKEHSLAYRFVFTQAGIWAVYERYPVNRKLKCEKLPDCYPTHLRQVEPCCDSSASGECLPVRHRPQECLTSSESGECLPFRHRPQECQPSSYSCSSSSSSSCSSISTVEDPETLCCSSSSSSSEDCCGYYNDLTSSSSFEEGECCGFYDDVSQSSSFEEPECCGYFNDLTQESSSSSSSCSSECSDSCDEGKCEDKDCYYFSYKHCRYYKLRNGQRKYIDHCGRYFKYDCKKDCYKESKFPCKFACNPCDLKPIKVKCEKSCVAPPKKWLKKGCEDTLPAGFVYAKYLKENCGFEDYCIVVDPTKCQVVWKINGCEVLTLKYPGRRTDLMTCLVDYGGKDEQIHSKKFQVGYMTGSQLDAQYPKDCEFVTGLVPLLCEGDYRKSFRKFVTDSTDVKYRLFGQGAELLATDLAVYQCKTCEEACYACPRSKYQEQPQQPEKKHHSKYHQHQCFKECSSETWCGSYNQLADQFHGAKYRVTVVDVNGVVVYDNKTNYQALDNHANRPEIQAALQNGRGYDYRQSQSINQPTTYYSQLIHDSYGQPYRIARVGEF